MELTLLVCKRIETENFRIEEYVSSDSIFALVESGRFVLNDGTGKETVNALEAVNFSSGKFYHRKTLEPIVLYLFRYQAEREPFPPGKVTFCDTDRIRSTLKLLRLSDGDFHANDFRYKKSLFLDLVTQYQLENAKEYEKLIHDDPVIAQAVEQINASLHQRPDLRAFAAAHYLSYVQFLRRFKNALGTTPQNYLANQRMKKAQLLLEETQLRINEIAVECGFANAYYFSNFFRKHHHISPSKFREAAQRAGET